MIRINNYSFELLFLFTFLMRKTLDTPCSMAFYILEVFKGLYNFTSFKQQAAGNFVPFLKQACGTQLCRPPSWHTLHRVWPLFSLGLRSVHCDVTPTLCWNELFLRSLESPMWGQFLQPPDFFPPIGCPSSSHPIYFIKSPSHQRLSK